VVGFGNWIKVVRLQDEEDNEDVGHEDGDARSWP
jgi:hypothetical protein